VFGGGRGLFWLGVGIFFLLLSAGIVGGKPPQCRDGSVRLLADIGAVRNWRTQYAVGLRVARSYRPSLSALMRLISSIDLWST